MEEFQAPLLLHAVEAAPLPGGATLVITGHASEAIERLLPKEGLHSSQSQLYPGSQHLLACWLGGATGRCRRRRRLARRYAKVTAGIIDRLIAFSPIEGRSICLPMREGTAAIRSFARRYFAEVMEISGDLGARPLLGAIRTRLPKSPCPMMPSSPMSTRRRIWKVCVAAEAACQSEAFRKPERKPRWLHQRGHDIRSRLI